MKQQATGLKTGLLLEKLRNRLDQIDHEILTLLAARQTIAQEIGQEKKRLGLDVVDLAREQAVVERLARDAKHPLSSQAIRVIYREIISAARSVQQPIAVGYLGPEGSFCHQAALRFFGKLSGLQAYGTIEDVFSVVERGKCNMGIVPVENSYQGSVGTTLDLLYEYDLKVQGEIFLRIRHHLLSNQDKTENVDCVYSHPMALAQCRAWLRENLPGIKIIETASTSEAARLATNRQGAAAVGSEIAADIYKLKVLVRDIEDRPDNVTRFLIIGKNAAWRGLRSKTSVLFSLPHRPGALSRVISPLAKARINMTRIESRPAKGKKWEYLFFVDIEGHKEDPRIAQALKEMEEACSYFKDLGSYSAGGEPWD